MLETCFGLGLILGPTVGGALYEWVGYSLPFISLGSFLLLGGVLTFCCLPSSGEGRLLDQLVTNQSITN